LGVYRGPTQEKPRFPYPAADGFSVAWGSASAVWPETIDRLEHEELGLVRDLTKMALEFTNLVMGGTLKCRRKQGKPHVEACFTFRSLRDALEWMVWQDEYRRSPIQFCQECNGVFRTTSAHPRKYCSPVCGHRV